MEVMHERKAHNFPLDLASVEAPSVNGWLYSTLFHFVHFVNKMDKVKKRKQWLRGQKFHL